MPIIRIDSIETLPLLSGGDLNVVVRGMNLDVSDLRVESRATARDAWVDLTSAVQYRSKRCMILSRPDYFVAPRSTSFQLRACRIRACNISNIKEGFFHPGDRRLPSLSKIMVRPAERIEGSDEDMTIVAYGEYLDSRDLRVGLKHVKKDEIPWSSVDDRVVWRSDTALVVHFPQYPCEVEAGKPVNTHLQVGLVAHPVGLHAEAECTFRVIGGSAGIEAEPTFDHIEALPQSRRSESDLTIVIDGKGLDTDGLRIEVLDPSSGKVIVLSDHIVRFRSRGCAIVSLPDWSADDQTIPLEMTPIWGNHRGVPTPFTIEQRHPTLTRTSAIPEPYSSEPLAPGEPLTVLIEGEGLLARGLRVEVTVDNGAHWVPVDDVIGSTSDTLLVLKLAIDHPLYDAIVTARHPYYRARIEVPGWTPADGDVVEIGPFSDNFHLAPQPRVVDGFTAVPIDIQHLAARIELDASARTCVVHATISFLVGEAGGHPAFDLRPDIQHAMLDGLPLEPDEMSHHNFGPGTGADLRIVQQWLEPNSFHQLALRYRIPLSDAAVGDDARVRWRWRPDEGSKLFVEQYLPGNLIFDQFPATLEVVLANAAVEHSLITNAESAMSRTPGRQKWYVRWPERWTSQSLLLALWPSDKVQSASAKAAHGSVLVTAYAFEHTEDIGKGLEGIALIAGTELTDKLYHGPYIHGDRFTTIEEEHYRHWSGSGAAAFPFFNTEGGPEAQLGMKEPESQLWGHGIQPATPSDARIGLMIITQNSVKPVPNPTPFDFYKDPCQLVPLDPWVRTGSFPALEDPASNLTHEWWFGEGLLDMVERAKFGGKRGTLRTILRDFFVWRTDKARCEDRPMQTIELESWLLARLGQPALVDAFHRFVYGFDSYGFDSSRLGPLLRFKTQFDLWVRHHPDDVEEHQDVVMGQDHWLYARLRNAGGMARHFMVTFSLLSRSKTEMIYPQDFLPATIATGGFDLAHDEARVIRAYLPKEFLPALSPNSCLLAAAFADRLHPALHSKVPDQDALAQRNLNVIER